MLKKILAMVSGACLLFSGAAGAVVTNFQFSGIVTYGGSLAPTGSTISGGFSYDTNASPSIAFGNYASYSAPFAFSVSVAGHNIAINTMHIDIWNNFGGNVEDMVNISGGAPIVDGVSYAQGSFGFNLASKAGSINVLTDTALPLSYNVAAFDAGPTQNYGWLQSNGSPSGTLLRFSVNSVTSTVPVPAAAWLLGSGLIGLIGLARKHTMA